MKERINKQIFAKELRVIGAEGENIGVISATEAIKLAEEAGLDLIEIAPRALPPVAKIMDYGKYMYEQKKKEKEAKSKAHITETKAIQVKIGTSENDLSMKAKQASKWLDEGHRLKVELYLRGRSKYMKKEFLQERLKRILDLIQVPYKIAENYKDSPKGIMVTIERDGKKSKAEILTKEKKDENK